MTDIKLPEWAAQDESGAIELDPAIAYPHYIGLLGLGVDKYGAEVARRCAIADLKALCGVPLRVKIMKRPDWALSALPGSDEDAQRGADGFRQHYDKLTRKRAARFMAAGDL
jgi:hypothetical protein